MNPLVTDFKNFAQKVILQLKEDLKGIRSGKASPALLENLTVEAYGGTKMRLQELATITAEGTAALAIIPYDPATVSDIEKGILKSPLGMTPQTQGSKIILRIPPLSQEQREKMIKLLSQKIEERKIMIRNYRDESRKKIKQQQEAKTMTEDQRYKLEKDIDTQTQNFMEEIQTIREHKETEMREV